MKITKPEIPAAQGSASTSQHPAPPMDGESEARGLPWAVVPGILSPATLGHPCASQDAQQPPSVHVAGEQSERFKMPEAVARATEQELRNLEFRIDELIQVCDRLREENTLLRGQQSGLLAERANLLAERAHLIKKTEIASSRVESMILRFKSMEYDA
jgi:cell division protein ZapB